MMSLNSTCLAVIILVIGLAQTSRAQTLEKAYVLAEPLQYVSQGTFRGCGINLKLLQQSEAASRDYATVSINFYVENPGLALVKTTLSKLTIGPTPVVRSQSLVSSWVRLKGANALVPKKSIQGEEQSLLDLVDSSSAIDFVTEVMRGAEEVQLGIKQSGLKHERVFYGVVSVEQETRRLFQECLGEFIGRLKGAP